MEGAHAEEEYLLMDVLSGCIIKSYVSVTEGMGLLAEAGGASGGVLREEESS